MTGKNTWNSSKAYLCFSLFKPSSTTPSPNILPSHMRTLRQREFKIPCPVSHS